MAEDRFPELTACNAAKQAVEEFDKKHASKMQAIIKLAAILQRGGWSAIRFEEETPFVPTFERQPEVDGNMVSKKALEGDSVATIVQERKYLMQKWAAAYAAVPAEIRASASDPDSRGSAARLREPPRRR